MINDAMKTKCEVSECGRDAEVALVAEFPAGPDKQEFMALTGGKQFTVKKDLCEFHARLYEESFVIYTRIKIQNAEMLT